MTLAYTGIRVGELCALKWKDIDFNKKEISIYKTYYNPTNKRLRHTHASLLAQAGVSLEEIMERLGHKDDSITREIYLHVTQDMKKEASSKFMNLLKTAK